VATRTCVCETVNPQSLGWCGVYGVTAGHLGVGGCVPEGDALPEGECAPRRGVLSSKVDHLSGPDRGPSATPWPSGRWGEQDRWSKSPPSSADAVTARLVASSTNTEVIRGGESSPNM
jgi:hypothetical protein